VSIWTNAPVVLFVGPPGRHGGVANAAGTTGALVHMDTFQFVTASAQRRQHVVARDAAACASCTAGR
jgi:hypothetical protein